MKRSSHPVHSRNSDKVRSVNKTRRYVPRLQALEDRTLLAVSAAAADALFSGVQQSLNDRVFNRPIPLVGNALGQAGSVGQVVTDLKPQLVSAVSTTGNLADALFTQLGPGGRNVLADINSSGSVDRNDVRQSVSSGVVTYEVELRVARTGQANFNLALPNVPLRLDDPANKVNVSAQYTIPLQITVDATGTNASVATPAGRPLMIAVTATAAQLNNTPGTAGVFRSQISDDPANRTNFNGTFTVTLAGSQVDTSVLNGTANVRLKLRNNFGGTSGGSFDLAVLADFELTKAYTQADTRNTTAPFGAAPVAAFKNVRLDMGQFFTRFVAPIFERIQTVTKPLQPIIDFFNFTIPVLSDIMGAPVTVATLVAQMGRGGSTLTTFLRIAGVINQFDVRNSVPDLGSNALLPLGDLLITNADSTAPSIGNSLTVSMGTAELKAEAKRESERMSDDGRRRATLERGAAAGAEFGLADGFAFPFLENPRLIGQGLLGQDITLFTFDLPQLSAGFTIEATFFPFLPVPLFVRVGGGISISADLKFGFDTFGLSQYAAERARSGDNANPGLIANGFYVSDRANADGTGEDTPEFSIEGTIELTAGLGLPQIPILQFEMGITGGISAGIDFDLHDPDPDGAGPRQPDGKVHLNELVARARLSPLCIFDIGANLEASAEVFARASLDFEVFSITLFDVTYTLGSVDILEALGVDGTLFSCEDPGPPVLGTLSNGVLTLTPTGDADFYVITHTGGTAGNETVVITSGEFSAEFTGVREIAASLGDGNDSVSVLGGVLANARLDGGGGDDFLTYQGSGTATLVGGAGDDSLRSSGGTSSLDGGDGSDSLAYVGLNSATLTGGSGADSLTGGRGATSMRGDDGDDLLQGGDPGETLDGGSGDDTVRGGGGADALTGGVGNDVLDGEDGNDTLRGDDGNDMLTGGLGDDCVSGGQGADRFYWTSGDGADRLDGGSGLDTPRSRFVGGDFLALIGTAGNDRVLLQQDTARTSRLFVSFNNDGILSVEGMESLRLDTYDGADTVSVDHLAPSNRQQISLHLNRPDESADGAEDRVLFFGTAEDAEALYIPGTLVPSIHDIPTSPVPGTGFTLRAVRRNDPVPGPNTIPTTAEVAANYRWAITLPDGTTPTAAQGSGASFLFTPAQSGMHTARLSYTSAAGDVVTNVNTFNVQVPSFDAATTLPSSPALTVAVGDFNGDSRDDVVTVGTGGPNADRVNVLLAARDGLGFQGRAATPFLANSATGISRVQVADMNNDGIPDLVTTTSNGSVGVLLGNRNGTFRDVQTSTAFLCGRNGTCPSVGFSVADVNSDGKLDVVIADQGSATVSVLLGDGAGRLGLSRLGVGLAGGVASAVAVADMNGDGQLDLVITHSGAGSVLEVLLSNGDGTFRNPRTFAAGAGSTTLAVADVNGDRHPDALIADGTGQVLRFGTGDGGFRPQTVTLADAGPASTTAFVDFNGDGQLDLLVTQHGGRVAVYLGNGDGTFRARLEPNLGGVVPKRVEAGDLNNDGRPDLLVRAAGPSPSSPSPLFYYLGNGDGTFRPGVEVPILNNDFASATPDNFVDIGVGDLDGDGRTDLVVTALQQAPNIVRVNPLRVLINGLFSAPQSFSLQGDGGRAAVAADFTGDGKLDLAVASSTRGLVRVFAGNGNGTFAAPRDTPLDYRIDALAVGDFNRDGRPDLAAADYAGGFVAALLNTGAGFFLPYVLSGNPGPRSADANNDGIPDNLALAATPQSVTVGDFDRDGFDDIAATALDPVNPNSGLVLQPRQDPTNSRVMVYLNQSPQSGGVPFATQGALQRGLLRTDYASSSPLSSFSTTFSPSIPDPAVTPTGTRVIPNVNFTGGSSAGGVRADGTLLDSNYGSVIAGQILITEAANVRFFVTSDDGSRLFINGKLVVDNSGVHDTQTRTGTVFLSRGLHDLRLEYFEATGGESLVLTYNPQGGQTQFPIPPQVLFWPRQAISSGLRRSDYDFAPGVALVDFPGYEDVRFPSQVVTTATVNFPTGYTGPGSTGVFASVFSGRIRLPAGTTTFFLESDDGSRLFLDGQLVVNNGGTHGMQERSGSVTVAAGWHDLRIEYFQAGGGMGIILRYTPPGGVKQVVPASVLFSAAEPPANPLLRAYYPLANIESAFRDFNVFNPVNLAPQQPTRVATTDFTSSPFSGSYGLVYTGQIYLGESRNYTFSFLTPADPNATRGFAQAAIARIFLDGRELPLQTEDQIFNFRSSGTFSLQAGYHDIRVDFVRFVAATPVSFQLLMDNRPLTFASYTLPTGAAGSRFDVGLNPRAVTTGDFDTDGFLDLVVANQDSFTQPGPRRGTVSLLRGNGNGTFQAARNFATPSQVNSTQEGPRTLVAGDFNGDGVLDVITANFNANAASSFSTALGSTVSELRGVGSELSALAYAVFRGTPGNQDFGGSLGMDFNVNRPVVITHLGVFDDLSNGLAVPLSARLYNRDTGVVVASLAFPAGNTGTLDGGSRYLPLPTPITLPAGFRGTIVAEGYGPTERNGNRNLGTVNQLFSDLGGSLNNTITFGGGRHGPAGSFPTNLDSRTSPYAAGTFRFTTFAGTGNFRDPFAYAVGRSPAALAAGDFNGDRRQDLVTVNLPFDGGSPTLALLNSNPTFASPGGPYTVTEGGTLVLDASGTISTSLEGATFSWDVNGDGVFGDAFGVRPTLTWNQLNALGITDGPRTVFNVDVLVTLPPHLGGRATRAFTRTQITVHNAPPTLTVAAPPQVEENGLFTLTLAARDPGADAVRSWRINWGDGSPAETVAGNPTAATHRYADQGTYSIQASATDEDGTYQFRLTAIPDFERPRQEFFSLDEQNIAARGTATQSSTGFGGDASRAIDGNTNGNWGNGSVTHTNSEANSFWEVTFPVASPLSRIVLFNRADCCGARLSNFTVTVFGSDNTTVAFQQAFFSTGSVPQGDNFTITLPSRVVGRRVRIQLNGLNNEGNGFLSLAEVQVFAPATVVQVPPLAPTLRTVVSQVSFGTGPTTQFNGLPNLRDNFAARYTGVLDVTTEGLTTFHVASNDGSRLFIDGRLVVDNSGVRSNLVEVSGTVFLTRGLHELRLEYFQEFSTANLFLSWTPAGGTRQSIPASVLSHSEPGLRPGGVVPLLIPPGANTSAPVNIAPMGTASQSSTAHGGSASRAIDGNTNGNWGNGSVTHTNDEADSFWEVTFPVAARLSHIVLFNRADCCGTRLSNFTVTVFGPDNHTRAFEEFSLTPVAQGGSRTIPLPEGTIGRRVRVQLNGRNNEGNGILSLAEVQVFAPADGPAVGRLFVPPSGATSTDVNIAARGTATQSTTAFGGDASRAIDGNTNGNWGAGSVTHTNDEANSFWEDTFPTAFPLSRIVLFNRADCCGARLSNFTVTVFGSDNTTVAFQQSFFRTGSVSGGGSFTIPLPEGIVGRRVRIQLNGRNNDGNGILSLAEVQIFAPAVQVQFFLPAGELLIDGTMRLAAGIDPNAPLVAVLTPGYHDIVFTGPTRPLPVIRYAIPGQNIEGTLSADDPLVSHREPGLVAEYYTFTTVTVTNVAPTGSLTLAPALTNLPTDFSTLQLAHVGSVPNIDLRHPAGAGFAGFDTLVQDFAARWTGTIQIEADGPTQFSLTSIGGGRVFIDNQEVVRNDNPNGTRTTAQTTIGPEVILTRGEHTLRVEVFEPHAGSNSTGNGFTLGQRRGGAPGQAVQVISPLFGNALRFDGVDDFVEFPRPVQDDFTIAFWINTTQVAYSDGQWWQGAGVISGELNGLNRDFGITLGQGRIMVGMPNGANTQDVTLSGPFIADGQWHHVAVVRNKRFGDLDLYVDGVQSSRAFVTGATLDGPARLRLGSHPTGVNFFAGMLDDVVFWNFTHLFSSEGVLGNRFSRSQPDDPNGAVAYYPLNDTNGTAADAIRGAAGAGVYGSGSARPVPVTTTFDVVPASRLSGNRVGTSTFPSSGLLAEYFFSRELPVGGTATLVLGNASDLSSPDRAAGFRYSFDFNNDGDFTDPGEVEDSPTSSITVPASILASPGVRTIRGRIKDKDGGFTDTFSSLRVIARDSTTSLLVLNGINVAPMIQDDVLTPEVVLGEAAVLSGTLVEFNEGDALSLVVDWGDDSPLQTFHPGLEPFAFGHVYAQAGTYTVRFVWLDDKGGSNTRARLVRVVAPEPLITNVAPVVRDVALTLDIGPGGTAVFSGRLDDPNDGDVLRLVIDWGDGSAPETFQPGRDPFTVQHVYAAAGTYTVRYTALDDQGGQDTRTRQVLVASPDIRFVTGLYRELLLREPEVEGLTYWVALLRGGSSPAQVAQAIWESPEHRRLQVQGYYQAYLHRDGEEAGLTYWVTLLRQGVREQEVIVGFLTSEEYRSLHAGRDADQIVAGLYRDLLQREGEAEERAYWMALLEAGATEAEIARGFLHSEEYRLRQIDHFYSTFLDRDAEAEGRYYWASLLQSGLSEREVVLGFLSSPEYLRARGLESAAGSQRDDPNRSLGGGDLEDTPSAGEDHTASAGRRR